MKLTLKLIAVNKEEKNYALTTDNSILFKKNGPWRFSWSKFQMFQIVHCDFGPSEGDIEARHWLLEGYLFASINLLTTPSR